MTVILSSVNLKGGVGKTAISVNFAAYCGRKGLRTLLIDLDPQTNASFSVLGVEKWQKHAMEKGTLADLLGARKHVRAEGKSRTVADVRYREAFSGVDLIPSHLDLFTVDLDLANATARETKLRKALRSIQDEYDIIICDCPPNLTLPTQNALAVSTHFVVPVSLDFLSALGISLLLNRVAELGRELEINLINAGIIISRVGRPAMHRTETEASIRESFKDDVLEKVLRERAAVSKAVEERKSVFELTDRSAAEEFTLVFDELCGRLGLSV